MISEKLKMNTFYDIHQVASPFFFTYETVLRTNTLRFGDANSHLTYFARIKTLALPSNKTVKKATNVR